MRPVAAPDGQVAGACCCRCICCRSGSPRNRYRMLWHLHPWGRRPCFSVLVVARKEVRPRSVAHHARASGMPGAWAATVCQSASAPWVPAPARLSRSTTRVISNLKSGFVVGSAFLAWLYYTQRHHSCISTRTHCGTCTPPASRSFKVCPTVCRTAWHAHKSPAARCIKLERRPLPGMKLPAAAAG